MAPVIDESPTPGNMNNLKPVNKKDAIDLPSCMYNVKSIHEDANKSDIEAGMSPDMKAIHQRQTKILNQLNQLTKEVEIISQKVGHKFGEQAETTIKSATTKQSKVFPEPKLPPGLLDYVISVSPDNPSISPVLIALILRARGIAVSTPTQLHSSLTESIPDRFLQLCGGLRGRVQVNQTKVNFTFVWKKEAFGPSLLYSPHLQTRIYGDINIARYLTRTFLPDLYDETDVCAVTQIDHWLEYSRQILHGSTKEKDAALKSLNARLGQHEHICNDAMTLADVVTLSAVLTKCEKFQALPKNIKTWASSAPKPLLDLAPTIWTDMKL